MQLLLESAPGVAVASGVVLDGRLVAFDTGFASPPVSRRTRGWIDAGQQGIPHTDPKGSSGASRRPRSKPGDNPLPQG